MTIESILQELEINPSFIGKLNEFIALFAKWNASINLSAATTPEEITEHVIDCLHVVPFLRDRRDVLDVGSGGGFPVVVTAICLPDQDFTALEPVHKKHAFLKTAARTLKLANLVSFARRVEDHDRADYDAATSRATWDLREWLDAGLKLVNEGGIVVGFEAQRRGDLLAAVSRHPYVLGDKQRAIVIARKGS